MSWLVGSDRLYLSDVRSENAISLAGFSIITTIVSLARNLYCINSGLKSMGRIARILIIL